MEFHKIHKNQMNSIILEEIQLFEPPSANPYYAQGFYRCLGDFFVLMGSIKTNFELFY